MIHGWITRLCNERPKSAGSGTFVRFGNHAGILTCAHVIHALQDQSRRGNADFGIVTFAARSDALHHIRIRFDTTVPVTLGEPPWSIQGPDIGFLRLSSSDLSTLEAQVTTVDGDMQRSIAVKPHRMTSCIEIVAGVIDEWTSLETKPGRRPRATIRGLLNVGAVESQDEAGDFDILRFLPDQEQDLELPSSFAGTSGGGIWRLFVEESVEGTLALLEKRLVGVAFYEFEGRIIGHGPGSIYNRLRKAVMTSP